MKKRFDPLNAYGELDEKPFDVLDPYGEAREKRFNDMAPDKGHPGPPKEIPAEDIIRSTP